MAKCKHPYRGIDPQARVWRCTVCRAEVDPFPGQESLMPECEHRNRTIKSRRVGNKPDGTPLFEKEQMCRDCGEELDPNFGKKGVWPGEVNTENITKFQFQCQNDKDCPLEGERILWADFEEPPYLIPLEAVCPYCESQMFCIPDISFNGVVVGSDNPHYSKRLADSEHKWMELQIEESKKAIKGKTGARPYSTAKIDYEYWEKEGVAKKTTVDEAADRKKVIDERNKTIAEKSKDKIDKTHLKDYVGKTKQ